MAGQHARRLLRVLINNVPLVREVEDYTSAIPAKELADTRGGGFIKGKILTGIEAMQGTIKIKGIMPLLAKQYGYGPGSRIVITIKESFEDEDGEKISSQEDWIGTIGKRERGGGASPEDTLTIEVDSSKRVVGGQLEHHVDRLAHICDLGQGDLLADHRAGVGL